MRFLPFTKRWKQNRCLEELSKLYGVPFGFFRCDICKEPRLVYYIAGIIINFGYASGEKVGSYTVCSICQYRVGLVEYDSGFLGHEDENGNGYIDWDRIKKYMSEIALDK